MGYLLLAGWLGVYKSWVIVLYCMYKVQTSLPQGGKTKTKKERKRIDPVYCFSLWLASIPELFCVEWCCVREGGPEDLSSLLREHMLRVRF